MVRWAPFLLFVGLFKTLSVASAGEASLLLGFLRDLATSIVTFWIFQRGARLHQVEAVPDRTVTSRFLLDLDRIGPQPVEIEYLYISTSLDQLRYAVPSNIAARYNPLSVWIPAKAVNNNSLFHEASFSFTPTSLSARGMQVERGLLPEKDSLSYFRGNFS